MLDVTKRVLLFVEDDDSLLQQMKEYFINLDNEVYTATSLEEAKKAVQSIAFDAIVLDVVLPDGSGLELLKDTQLPPVIILSDLSDEKNILEGFENGIVDYIVKPCSMLLLKTRLSLRLLPIEKSVIECRGIKLNIRYRSVFYQQKEIHLTSSEFNILHFLMTHPNQFFLAYEIYEQVWKSKSLNTTTIKRHLSTLRRKMIEVEPKKTFILTQFGNGYAFISEERI